MVLRFLFISLAVPFIMTSHVLSAQNSDFRPVRVRDFDKTALSGESDYDALVLFRKHYTYFSPDHQDFSNNTIVHERLLIKNEKGLRHATQLVTLFKGQDDGEKVVDISGTTYNLVDGEIITSPLEKGGIFNEQIDEFRDGVKFTMPAASKGSIIDFYYKIVSPFIYLRDIPLQYEIPINHMEIDVRLSRSIVYNVAFNPEAIYQLSFSEEIKDEFLKNLKDFDPPKTEKNNLLDDKSILTAKNKTVSVKTGAVPAYKFEENSGGRNRYRAKLLFEVAAVWDGYGRYKYYSTDWKAVTRSIMESQYFGGQLKSRGFFKNELRKVITAEKDEKQKTIDILKFLQKRVKWNGSVGKFVDGGVKNAYQKGSGNAAEVNLLLVSMLEESGITAYPVLTGTQNADTPVFPTRDGFNYVIAQVEVDGENYLLDATELFTTFDVLPDRVAQWKGRVILSEVKSKWIDLERNTSSDIVEKTTVNFDSDLSASFSTIRTQDHFSGYTARREFTNADAQKIKKELVDNITGIKVEKYKFQNLSTNNKPIVTTFSGTLDGGWDVVDNKVFIVPLSFHALTINPYSDMERKQPFYLPFPINQRREVVIQVPDNFQLESLPQPLNLTFDQGKGTYSFKAIEEDGVIKTITELNLPFSKIQATKYSDFQKFFSVIRDKEDDRLIFVKKQ